MAFVDFSDNLPLSQEKFDTCKNRTPEKVEGRVRSCCGRNRATKDFACQLKKIFPLDAVKHCQGCKEYEKK